MRYVDLTHVINNQLPVYPGDPQVKVSEVATLAHDGYTEHSLHIGSHAGTHVDVPAHMIKDGKTLEQIPVDAFIGHGRLIRVNDCEFNLKDVQAAGIEPGDIVLFYTGLSGQFNEPEYFEKAPALPEDIAEYLVEQKVKMVGMDLASPDYEPYAVHKILLGGGTLIAENLCNLEQLEGKEFKIYALPIKLAVDGAPARVVAEISE
jgi:arylformamidase